MKLKLALAVLLLAAGAWALEAHARAGTQRTLGAVASELAGRPVSVRCQSLWAALLSIQAHDGEVRFDARGRPADSAWLTRAACGELHRFVSTHGRDLECLRSVDWGGFHWAGPHGACVGRVEPEAQAVVTLAHESMHLRGIADEAQAQCLAEQEATRTVELLGGDPATGPALESLARAWNGAMPAAYQGACPSG